MKISNNVLEARITHNFDLNYCVSIITINENNSPQYLDLPLCFQKPKCHEKISHNYTYLGNVMGEYIL